MVRTTFGCLGTGSQRSRRLASDNYITQLATNLEEGKLLYEEVYKKAWGVRWPRDSGAIIDKGFKPDEDIRAGVDDDPSSHARREEMPMRWDYTYLLDIGTLGQNLGIPSNVQPKLVIRDEYERIRVAMDAQVEDARKRDQGSPCFVLTGQPGIGKTAFLLYLLLHRLERRLPTAIQVGSQEYAVFDAKGVAMLSAYSTSKRLTPDCWALCDSNGVVDRPCQDFLASESVVVQAALLEQQGWKTWAKRKYADAIVMDLPRPLEIAAIAQEVGYNPAKAITLVQKWGPETRTVMKILARPVRERQHMRQVERAAANVARNPQVILSADADRLTRDASTLLFIRPVRNALTGADNEVDLSSFVLEIPTPTLAEIFDRVGGDTPNNEVLLNALGRTQISVDGWIL